MLVNVISIINSERTQRVLLRLTSLGFTPKVSPAVDLRQKKLDCLSDVFNIKSFEARYDRTPSAGEIGCTLSHLLAIRHLGADGLSGEGVIFEDDVIPLCRSAIFEQIYADILASPFDIVVLGYSKADNNTEAYVNIVNPFLSIFRSVSPYAIGARYQHTTSGAVGYVVKKRGVAMLSAIETPCHLADDWVYYASLGLNIGYVSPMLVREDILGVNSTLGHDCGFIAPKNHKSAFVRMLLIIRRRLIGFYRLRIMKLKYARFNFRQRPVQPGTSRIS